MTKAGFWLNIAITTLGIIAFVAMAGFFGYKWLAHDEADRAHACGSGSRGGLCLEGETTNMILTIVFGCVAVIGVVLLTREFRSQRLRERGLSDV